MILERRICKTKLFYDDIWVDHAAIDPHIEVNVPTTAARAKGTLDLQNLGACLVLDHESGGRWRWWRQWWWRWWRSWHEIAQKHFVVGLSVHAFILSFLISFRTLILPPPPHCRKILIFWGVGITSLMPPTPSLIWSTSFIKSMDSFQANFDDPILKISPPPKKKWFKITTWAEDWFW